ncbi:MAG: GTP 3',8-cyclase MoaA [Euryarchaeota archaeon]
MRDALGRRVDSVRATLTLRCNMDCVYCHREGESPSGRELTCEEWVRVLRACARLGLRRVKFTGGEPTLREDLPLIIEGIRDRFRDVSLTTNGSLLRRRADELREAGLDRVNVSLDTLDPSLYRAITRSRHSPREVLRGIETAISVGLTPVKVNVVLFRETLEGIRELTEELADECEHARLQLIEPMLNADAGMRPATVREALRELSDLKPRLIRVRKFQNRSVYRLENGITIEAIRPKSGEMCWTCSRIRITHDGKFKGCILSRPRRLPVDSYRDLLGTLRRYIRERDDTMPGGRRGVRGDRARGR